MLTETEAKKIAAEKAVEAFGRKELGRFDGWFETQEHSVVLALAEQSSDSDSKLSLDDTNPWKRVFYIEVSLNTGESNITQRENVTIFD